MGDAQIRQYDEQIKSRALEPAYAATQAAAQVTTDAYTLVDDSVIDAKGRRRVGYTVKNTDGANAIKARLVGRHYSEDADGVLTPGPWVPAKDSAGAIIEAAGIAAGAADYLSSEAEFDEYGVEIAANVGGAQGDAEVSGAAYGAWA